MNAGHSWVITGSAGTRASLALDVGAACAIGVLPGLPQRWLASAICLNCIVLRRGLRSLTKSDQKQQVALETAGLDSCHTVLQDEHLVRRH